MRGKGQRLDLRKALDRITPAYAGKSGHVKISNYLTRDHPRLCGEKGGFQHFMHLELGSPPPMRGKGHRRIQRIP